MARKRFGELSKEQTEVTPQTQWTAMLAGLPGVPKSPGGEGDDVVAYDNVVALTEEVDATGGQVFVGSLVRFGNVWRPLDLPQLPSSNGVVVESFSLFSPNVDGTPFHDAAATSETLQPYLEQLRALSKSAKLSGAALADLVTKRVQILEEVAELAEGNEREFWLRQLAETLAAAAQEGTMSGGSFSTRDSI